MSAKKPAKQLPRATFHSVALVVADRVKSVTWYTRNLGLDVIEQGTGDDAHWVVVGRKGRKGGVHLCDIPNFDPAFQVEPGESGIQFDLPGDFKKSCAALKANGVRFSTPRTQRPWGWYAKIVDPDGNEIRLNPK